MMKRLLRCTAVIALAFAMCFALLAVAGCSSTSSSTQKSAAQLNREYMSSVNSISSEVSSALSTFTESASKQDVAAMRIAAQDAAKAFEKIDALDVPDALSEVASEYKSAASDLSQALSDYVEIYANIKNAGEDTEAATKAAEGITDVNARYASGMDHLSKADSKVAELASSTSDATSDSSSK